MFLYLKQKTKHLLSISKIILPVFYTSNVIIKGWTQIQNELPKPYPKHERKKKEK